MARDAFLRPSVSLPSRPSGVSALLPGLSKKCPRNHQHSLSSGQQCADDWRHTPDL